MARGRRSEQIKRITRSDGETLKSIAHTGLITRSNAKEYFNLNEKRIELLKKNNYLIEHTSNTKQGLQTYYTLGSAGTNFSKAAATAEGRKKLAEEYNVPPYIIFGDKTLEQLVYEKPLSDFELENVYGLAAKKIERYGEQIIKVIEENI